LKGTLYIVATPIGNLEDISRRAVRILADVDLIAAEDTRTTKILLSRYDIHTPLTSYHTHNERERSHQLIEKLKSGSSVAVVSDAGTPGISDPAYRVINDAIEQDIRIVPVPGPSAFLTALIMSGAPIGNFSYEGFLPHKKGRKTRLEQLARERRTIVLYESPHRILRTLREIHRHMGNRRIVVARELTKKFEEVLRGTVAECADQLSNHPPRGEFVLVIFPPA
jgi:16S rRNA (cytidine1402-2'-O)-methyltransferase